MLLGDIDVGANELDYFAFAIDERMSHRMNVSCRTVWKIYAKIDFKVRFLPYRLVHHLGKPAPVFR